MEGDNGARKLENESMKRQRYLQAIQLRNIYITKHILLTNEHN